MHFQRSQNDIAAFVGKPRHKAIIKWFAKTLLLISTGVGSIKLPSTTRLANELEVISIGFMVRSLTPLSISFLYQRQLHNVPPCSDKTA